MHTPYWKRMAGNAICVLALAIVANLAVGPREFSSSERVIQWGLFGLCFVVGGGMIAAGLRARRSAVL